MESRPTTIGLVFGGYSGEHEVSIRSATTVIHGLRSGENSQRYRVIPFYIDQEGRWWGEAFANRVLASQKPIEPPHSIETKGLRELPEGSETVQVWYPVLHGPNGEDGTVQGLFKLMRQPFVGAGVLGSAVSMDKLAMKAAFTGAGLSQVPYVGLNASDLNDSARREGVLDRIEADLQYPCFVKPANLGSSVGISKVRNRDELETGLDHAAQLDPRLVVEQGVDARELECAVLGRDQLRSSVVGEVRFDADWYDYTTKYTAGLSTTVIPAELPEGVAERVQQQALEACAALGVVGMARVDFFYDNTSHQLWINEINTLPGFTSQSMYPMLWEASGVTLDQLVHKLVQSAGE